MFSDFLKKNGIILIRINSKYTERRGDIGGGWGEDMLHEGRGRQ